MRTTLCVFADVVMRMITLMTTNNMTVTLMMKKCMISFFFFIIKIRNLEGGASKCCIMTVAAKHFKVIMATKEAKKICFTVR